MRLIQIVDSVEYVNNNCWQSQLLQHLRSQCNEHIFVTRQDLVLEREIPDGDIILSTLKMRTLDSMSHVVGRKLKGRQIFIYDQDVWESFIDSGTIWGAYTRITNCMNVAAFIVTSKWWADYIATRNFRSIFTRMWLNDTLCSTGTPWIQRQTCVGFMGQLHPYRASAIEKLQHLGVAVTVKSSSKYNVFLDQLSQMQFFFHQEAERGWTIVGEPIGQNALWAKEIEIAGRGCIALRKHEDELYAYDIQEIPSVITYEDLSEVPDVIDSIDATVADSIIQRSVEYIKTHSGWFNLNDLLTFI